MLAHMIHEQERRSMLRRAGAKALELFDGHGGIAPHRRKVGTQRIDDHQVGGHPPDHGFDFRLRRYHAVGIERQRPIRQPRGRSGKAKKFALLRHHPGTVLDGVLVIQQQHADHVRGHSEKCRAGPGGGQGLFKP
jgi:hypothetical protein